ncbi:gtf2h3 [Nucleospora cyclopteri]
MGVIIDYNDSIGKEAINEYFSTIYAFLNAYKSTDENNSFFVINNRIIHETQQNSSNYNTVFGDRKLYPITTGDIGLCLLRECDAILLCTFHGQFLDFKNLIKCMHAAQELNVPIHTFTMSECNNLRLISEGTKGKYVCNDFVGLLGILREEKETRHGVFQIKCFCCQKYTAVGVCCPICLTVYCKFTPICKKCKTKFDFNTKRIN